MKKNVIILNCLFIVLLFLKPLFICYAGQKEPVRLSSPDKSVKIEILLRDKIYYRVIVDGVPVIKSSPLSMDILKEGSHEGFLKTKSYTTSKFDGQDLKLGCMPVLKNVCHSSHNKTIDPVFGRNNKIIDHYNQVELTFEKSFSIIFRVYNDGVVYRFITKYNKDIIIRNEHVEYRFEGYPEGFFPDNESYETTYTQKQLFSLDKSKDLYLPVVININDTLRAAITESDVYNYPSLLLKKSDDYDNNLVSCFANYPLTTKKGGFNNFGLAVDQEAEYIARTDGKRTYPWRVMIISKDDAALADNDLVYRLARPLAIKETEWIKPGKVAWDWWHNYNLQDVDFKTGINTNTYKYHIDFAAKNGIAYANIDWRWSDPFDLFLINPDVDIPYLVDYANNKGVGVILWCVSYTLDRQLERAMDQFKQWGVAGIKVDFFDREDQLANQMYERIAKAAAEHHLVVNFHGCTKPTGLNRAYPNILNFEAVKGQEGCKWGKSITPQHTVTIPFIRMINGPMDYTPGALRNASKGNFAPVSPPMSQGTRCHQMAMYIVYDAYMQMLCDMPTAYEQEPEIMDYLSEVSVTWDQTKTLQGQIGKYIVTARRNGNKWYVGAMTNWTGRKLSVDCSFLEPGNYKVKMYKDGINADKLATEFDISKFEIDNNSKLKIRLANGGGAVLCITPR